jgi:putative Holliday junction resolvase
LRALGLDHGSRRIGLALSDPAGICASPKGFMDTHPRKRLQKRLQALIDEMEVSVLVVGEPLGMDGSVGAQAQEARDFVVWLRSWCSLPVEMVDERLTSVMAERAMIEGGLRREERKKKRDAVAAAILLQGWLDARSSP